MLGLAYGILAVIIKKKLFGVDVVGVSGDARAPKIKQVKTDSA
tara:strand:- start:1742 stop:1870 length:129 start_codon:yes stop_codon:yes gene_type:complete